jgi:hypothetical protein
MSEASLPLVRRPAQPPPVAAALESAPLDLLRRYDRPGPRYTSYPTAVEFHERFGEGDYRDRLSGPRVRHTTRFPCTCTCRSARSGVRSAGAW